MLREETSFIINEILFMKWWQLMGYIGRFLFFSKK
ncbi:hypothetical protein AsAng_0027360 [Aureispira anguillae]|uniref:Uncharacterized protein n=1 Tax=Aureispira anguillae TaxID=2864201 RepID=A0A916DSP6_9BACT|nr:hypothetical protein AsAng_0027360 [Aureispira anguillae]